MRVPEFSRASHAGSHALARRASYPCVLKPLGLSASRGVIRANNPDEFDAAFRRIAKNRRAPVQVESYIPGREFAVEGMVTAGGQPLAIFDKPDPLEGPFFEETIYVTPSRESAEVQEGSSPPPHARCGPSDCATGRCTPNCGITRTARGCSETQARPIGGLCAKALRLR